MLSFNELVDARRHLLVPVAGVANSGDILRVGRLEFLLKHLQAEEEAVIAGRPIGVIQIFGTPTAGKQITVDITPIGGAAGAPIVYTITSADATSADPRLSVALNLANAITFSGQSLWAAGGDIPPNQDVSGRPNVLLPPFAQCSVTTNLLPAGFTLTASSNDPNMPVAVIRQGTFTSPQLKYVDDNNNIQYIYGMIPICNFLENAIYFATDNLDMEAAGATGAQGGAKFRLDELNQRELLYKRACRRLSLMFGRWSDGMPGGSYG